MNQTPAHDLTNPELISMIPKGTRRIVDVGCMRGSLAKAYKPDHPECEVIGIDIDSTYANVAAEWCDRVICADIEAMPLSIFDTLAASDCWVFGDSLEHLRDPWGILRKVRQSISNDGCVLACIPNAQHWSVQWRLASGQFYYEDQGLLDRTHVRWFTRETMIRLFIDTGWEIEQAISRTLHSPQNEMGLKGVRAFADAVGLNPDQAMADAGPIQYILKALPRY